MCPDRKLVAYRKLAPLALPSARPLYTAPSAGLGIIELSSSSTALCRSTCGAQAEMVPSSAAKMNRAGAVAPFPLTTKSAVPLKTTPVGAADEPPAGGGMVTTSGDPAGKGCPEPSYSVDTPVPLAETHQGEVGELTRPQGFTRLSSVTAAIPEMSETRFTWRYDGPASAPAA